MMSCRVRTMTRGLSPSLSLLLAASLACSSGSSARRGGAGGDPGDEETGGSEGATAGTGGKPSTGGTGGTGGKPFTGGTGGSAGASGGQSGSGGDEGGGSGGGTATDASAEDDAGETDAGADPADAALPPNPGGPIDFGGVGKLVLVPLQHTAAPVAPIIPSDCPGDPSQGFTEYEDSFVVQRPYTLAAADRFKYENGIYEFWVKSSDPAHKPGGTTAPRTEARYSDMSSGEHIWSADVMFESPSKTCVFQIHNVNSPIAIYLRIIGDRMFNLSTGTTILTGHTGKWFNLKVSFNAQTRDVKTYINNCLKESSKAPDTASVGKWYFKHGVYTCESGTCRSSYKNIHLYQRGSTDKYNVMSTFP
jgi:hypothetical protein